MRFLAIGVAAVALATVGLGWIQNPDGITAAEARSAAEDAFRATGLEHAVVGRHPTKDVYVAVEGDSPIDVWKTSAAFAGGTVELWLARSDGESVFLDDRSPDGSSQLLTDAQFRKLAGHFDNPAVGRQVRRNVFLTGAGALIMLLALALAAPDARAPATRALSGRAGASRFGLIRRRRAARTAMTLVPSVQRRDRPLRARPIRAPQETP